MALLIIVGSLLVGGALVLGWISARVGPTKGNRIADYANPQRAVVMIDLQEDYTGTEAKPPFPYKDSARVIQALNELFLAGLDAEYCVRSTARGALARGYMVNIITDGILLLADQCRDALLQKFQRDGVRLVASHDCLA